MSQQIVDTDRPEYSWIPFFEELAQRLHEDGWRHRQPEIVAELKRMKGDGMVIAGWADNLTDWIDPFSLIGTFRRRITSENAVQIMVSFKSFFSVDADLPIEDPITPPWENTRSFIFDNIGEDNQAETHWDLFEYVMSIDQPADDSDLAELLNRSVNIKWAGHANLSGALFWIKPHSYLKTDTIAHFLGTWNYSDFGRNYLENLVRIREIDSRPFPVLNADAWLTGQFLKSPQDFTVWQIRGGKDFYKVDYFIENGITAVDFGLNEIDMSLSWTRAEFEEQCRNLNSELSRFQIHETWRFSNEIVQGDLIVMPIDGGSTQVRYGFALSELPYHESESTDFRNRRGVIWREKTIATGDLHLPGAATVQEVGAARDDLLKRIVEAEGGVIQFGLDPANDDAGDTPVDEVDRKPNDEPSVWVVRANDGKYTDLLVRNGYVSIGWNEMDLSLCADRDAVDAEHARVYRRASNPSKARAVTFISRFLFEIEVGDYVITPRSNQEGRFYYGVVKGDCTFNHIDGRPHKTRRPVAWRSSDVREKSELPDTAWQPPTVYELTGDERRSFLECIEYTVDTMIAEGVFLDEPDLTRILAQLERKQNLILQGPPGTGKTFLAKKLAYALMGERADERIVSVQFHQSYAYEDFVGGYRPGLNDAEQLIFRARDGAFLELCERARHDPARRYVMLIDETNRGNLSKVFGELFMLIEADKRSERHAVELPHRVDMARNGATDAERFFVPPNVYIIGTMNLADRSLTGMNVAMRRRFGFADLKPQFGNPRFSDWLKTSRFLGDEKMPEAMQREIHRRMLDLNRKIASDPSLSKQYAVGHSFFCPDASHDPRDRDWDEWYRTVVEYEIRPLLDEYWFDDPGKAEREADALINDLPFRDVEDTDTLDVESEETD